MCIYMFIADNYKRRILSVTCFEWQRNQANNRLLREFPGDDDSICKSDLYPLTGVQDPLQGLALEHHSLLHITS